MIEISSQMREFVNFAQDAVANNAKNSIARLGKRDSIFFAFPIGAAADGDSVGKLRRSGASKRANDSVRSEFRKTVAQMFGGENNIPANVLDAMSLKDYQKGKPLTADRILDVYAAIKDHIATQKNAAFANGTLRALDVADTVANRVLEQFQKKHNVRLGAAVASNLKQALLLCSANLLDDNAVKGGEAAVRKFIHPLKDSFNYTLKALGFNTATRKIDVARIQDLMKDDLNMRASVFALLDKDGNVDVNHFEDLRAKFDDAWLNRCGTTIVRAEIDTPSPVAVKKLQKQFMLTAKQRVEDEARSEVEAFFKANPGKIPAALRNDPDPRAPRDYVGLVKDYALSQGTDEVATRRIYGDDTAKLDVAPALRTFNGFMDTIYATAEGDKDLIGLLERFAGKIAFNGDGALRSLPSIKKKFIEPLQDNLRELRTLAGGNAAIVKIGVDALVQSEMTPFKKGVFAKLANAAKKVDMSGLDSISERSTPIEIAKVFTELFGRFKKAMPPENYNDMRSRPERNAYTLFFAGVLMSRLDAAAKERMVKTFASDAAGVASNTMQTLISGGTDLTPVENDDLQDSAQMMRKCSTFIADDLSLDAEAFAVNEVKDNMKLADIPAEVADQYAGFIHAIQG